MSETTPAYVPDSDEQGGKSFPAAVADVVLPLERMQTTAALDPWRLVQVLSEEVAELRQALAPFAALPVGEFGSDSRIYVAHEGLTMGDVRRAKRVAARRRSPVDEEEALDQG